MLFGDHSKNFLPQVDSVSPERFTTLHFVLMSAIHLQMWWSTALIPALGRQAGGSLPAGG